MPHKIAAKSWRFLNVDSQRHPVGNSLLVSGTDGIASHHRYTADEQHDLFPCFLFPVLCLDKHILFQPSVRPRLTQNRAMVDENELTETTYPPPHGKLGVTRSCEHKMNSRCTHHHCFQDDEKFYNHSIFL